MEHIREVEIQINRSSNPRYEMSNNGSAIPHSNISIPRLSTFHKRESNLNVLEINSPKMSKISSNQRLSKLTADPRVSKVSSTFKHIAREQNSAIDKSSRKSNRFNVRA